MAAPTGGARRGRRRLRLPRSLWHLGGLLVLALIIEFLVVPQLAGTGKAIHTLARVDPLWLLLALVLEVASLVAYSLLTRTVLPADDFPGLWKVFRIQLATLSVGHCVPAGSAATAALGYRLLSGAGVRRSDAGFALTAQGLGSAVVLNVIFWLALVVSIPVWGFSPLYVVAAAVGVVVVGAFILVVWLFARGRRQADDVVRNVVRRIPGVSEEAVHALFERLAERLHSLARDKRTLAVAFGWAATNWLLDAAALLVCIGAFGYWVDPDRLLVSYGLANVLAAVPITPSGLGVVEATLTSTLVGFDTPRAIALLGVVAYRLINFWLPIPVGGIAYVSLQVDARGEGRGVRAFLGRWRREGFTAALAAARRAEEEQRSHPGVDGPGPAQDGPGAAGVDGPGPAQDGPRAAGVDGPGPAQDGPGAAGVDGPGPAQDGPRAAGVDGPGPAQDGPRAAGESPGPERDDAGAAGAAGPGPGRAADGPV